MAEVGTPMQLWLQQPKVVARKPLVMVLCPSRELGAQVGLQLYGLLGGNIRQDYSPDDRLSVFNFRGPRGMRILGLLDDEDADPENADVLACANAVVATPRVAARLFERDAAFFD